MTDADFLRSSFKSLEVNAECTEAVLVLTDASRLGFRHTVGERRAEATGTGPARADGTLAGKVLERIAQFRLNRKHLDVQFADGSRWEALFASAGGPG
jgi:hypothetical protein